MPLHIRSEKDNEQNHLIELKGSLDSDTYTHLEDELKKAENTGARSVSLSFSNVDYVSSIGMRVLIDGMKALKARQAPFLLFGLQPEVRKVFDIMRLTSVFEVLGSRSEVDHYLQEHCRIPS